MIRTQIFLTEPLYRRIDLVAKKVRKPRAEVIRQLLTDSLNLLQTEQANPGQALLGLAHLGERLKIKGPSDLSLNADTYLYDQ